MSRFDASSSAGRALLTVALTLVLGAVAAASTRSGSYHGRTGQGKGISLSVSSGRVSNIAFKINDTCPDRHTLEVAIGKQYFPAVPIGSKGSFGATVHPPQATDQPTSIQGRFSGNKVSGSISDTSRSPKEHKLCHGHTSFSASTK